MALPKTLGARYNPAENVTVYTTNAGGAITAGRFVRVTAKNAKGAYTGLHCTAGQAAFGVAERSVPAAPATAALTNNNHGTNVHRRGAIALVEAGAPVAIDALIASDGTGRGITAVSTNRVNGRALTAAAQAGDIIEVDLFDGGVVA